MRRKAAGMFGALIGAAALTTGLGGAAHAADSPYNSIYTNYHFNVECLDVRREDGWTTPGARIQQWRCSGQAQQQWKTHFVGQAEASRGGQNLYQIISQVSGMCLEINSHNSGALLQQNTCGTESEKLWTLTTCAG